ncbi:hypothetical protein CBS101457_005023 [Exobasidium rhododendri]|nr:hypothetical protein CBS101457_005023 [Exobasidium rhododendri]
MDETMSTTGVDGTEPSTATSDPLGTTAKSTTALSSASATSSVVSSSTTGLPSPVSTMPVSRASSSTAAGTAKQSGVDSGAIACAAVGALIVGLLLGSLFGLLLLKKRHQRKIKALEAQMENEKYPTESSSPPALMYADPSTERDLKKSQDRIVALERERNAASAFGDKLDGKSEQELLDSSAFGLSVYNEKTNQLAMSLAVSASGLTASEDKGPPSILGPNAAGALHKLGKRGAHSSIENVLCHVVNSIMLDRICTPFCFVAAEENKGKSMMKMSKDVAKHYDQAMFARWRAMSHAGLKLGCQDPSAKSAINILQQDVSDALAEAMVWAGMEIDTKAAVIKVSSVKSRIGEVALSLCKLMTILREEMTTANYEVIAVSKNEIVKSLGLAAISPAGGKSRVLLPPR